MSHKYYSFEKQEENNVYTIPFLSTKTQRLRFLNDDLVGYGERNEFVIHKKPGITIIRLNDDLISKGFQNNSISQNLMNEFLNQLLDKSKDYMDLKTMNLNNKVSIKQVNVNSKSSIRITLSSS